MKCSAAMRTWRIDVLGGSVLVCVCAATFLLGVQPLFKAGIERADLEIELSTLERQVELQSMATTSYAAALSLIDERLLEHPVELGDREQVSDVLAWVAQAAESHDMVIDSLIPKPPESDQVFDRVPIEMRGRGTYPDVAAFLHEIRERDVTLATRSFDLRAEDSTRLPTFSVELVWFVRPVPSSQ